MLATFCLRLAFGLIAALWVLPTALVPPRFFRVQYLTALGLLTVAGAFLGASGGGADAEFGLWLALGLSLAVSVAGSIVWHLDGHPGQGLILVLATSALAGALILGGHSTASDKDSAWLAADTLASAGVLGAATSAMLMGHSYLIAPAMSLSPLYRLLAALGATLAIRMILAGLGLYWWTGRPAPRNLETELLLWLSVRWVIGLVGPLVLGWMAWEAARIRSTQSATGILYVVVILGFLGELTSQLLWEKTGFIL
jgi:hypothetical protein